METGLPRPTIANFRDGKSVNSDTLDKIAAFFGAAIQFPAAMKGAKGKGRRGSAGSSTA